MPFDPMCHHRRSIRLKGFDYASPGKYFITICTQDKHCFFGHVTVGAGLVPAQMLLNHAGLMVQNLWLETIRRFQGVTSDKHVVMPNHFHAIIAIAAHEGRKAENVPTVGLVIQAFKSRTTVAYINGVKAGLYEPFKIRLWQRNYHEHILRDETDCCARWQYIDQNPVSWALDQYHISHTPIA